LRFYGTKNPGTKNPGKPAGVSTLLEILLEVTLLIPDDDYMAYVSTLLEILLKICAEADILSSAGFNPS